MLLEVVAVAVLSNCMAQQRPSTCVPPACSWNAGKSQCEGICVSMTPEECKKTSFCKWELDTCTQGCSLNADDASCKADDSCFWLPAFGLCQDSPCKDKNFSTCGPMMCQYDFAARTCNPNPCYILPPSACTGSCITRDYQGTPYCGPPISEIFCNYPPNECERQTHCEQGQKRCAMKDVAALCSAFSKQLPCLEQKLCDWDGQACVPVGCFSYTTRDRCRDLDYCMWKETEHYCAESANSTTCNEVPQKQCANVPLGCRWEAQRCSECSGNTRDACRGGCVWSEPRGACMGTSCEKLDATECSVRPLCRWRARLNTCVSPEDLQCSSISEQATCDDVPSCQWGAAACSPVNIQCDQLTSDVKCKWHAGCRWDASARVCGSKDSCDVKEDDRCYKSPGCSWISNLEKCTPMQFPECNTTVAAKCPSSSCEWQADKTMCNPRLGCVGFEQQMCKGACTWRNDKCVKSGKSCDIFDLRTACEGSECLGVSPVWKTGPMKGQKPFIDGQALIEVSPGIVTNANGELICNLGESCEVCLPGHVLNMQKTVSCSGDDIIVNGQLCVKLQDLQLQWGGTDPYNPCDADSEATCDPATCVWKNANGKCVAIMECLQLTQQQCEKAAKCQWDAVCRDKDNEGCMRRECIGGVCTRVPLHGATCVTDDDKPGICATVANVVKCKSLPSFADDCAAKPCKGATDDPKQCQDPDRTKNGVYECTCQEGMRLDKTTKKCTSQGVCSRSMRSSCSRLKQDCEVVNGVEACQQPTCLDACANVPAGCTQRLDKAENGCLLFPCEFVCDTCTDDEHRECRVQAHQTKKSLECIKENSTASCITKPCPVPQCPDNPPGCVTVPDVRLNPFSGCPLFPCGTLSCPDAVCTPEESLKCATKYGKRMACEMAASVSQCVPVYCPDIDCTPPPGCSFAPDAVLQAKKDASGCAIHACGELKCNSGCTEEEKKSCCDRSQPASSCRECVKNKGMVECIAPSCKQILKACQTTPGCEIKENSKDCDRPCGEEVCEAYDPCSDLQCNTIEICQVVGNTAICVAEHTSCGMCQSKRCIAGQCIPEDVCSNKMCPASTLCAVVGGEVKCLPKNTAACGGCDEGEKCISQRKWNQEQGSVLTEWVCKQMKLKAMCELDSCSCEGTPCEAEELCQVRIDGTPECMPEDAFEKYAEDPCGEILCPADFHCVVQNEMASCRARVTSVCKNTHCRKDQYCDEVTGECVDPPCTCPVGSKCVHYEGVTTCVENTVCSSTWNWFNNTCRMQSDCNDGTYCPAAPTTLLEACVSRHCKCNPLTGRPGSCSSSCHPELRRCLPNKWGCDIKRIDRWSKDEKMWCCAVKHIGCNVYSCTPAGSDGPETWSPQKKAFCCEKTKGVYGCRSSEYNCYTEEVWSVAKRKQCCKQGVGCPAPEHDCGDWKIGTWSDAKSKWCCEYEQIGCPEPIYNCTSEERWSVEKEEYCCVEHGDCNAPNKPLYNCDSEDVAEQAAWSPAQKEACCILNKGCAPDSSSVGPFSCDGLHQATKVRRTWCCLNRRIGCKGYDQCRGRITNGVQKPVAGTCCTTTRMGCDYKCSAEPMRIAKMSSKQSQYCCSELGLACNEDEITTETQEDALQQRNMTVYKVLVKFAFKWQRIMENPKDFTRKLLRTLVGALVRQSTRMANMSIAGFGPLSDDYSMPPEGSGRWAQKMAAPRSWGNDARTGEYLGDLSVNRDDAVPVGRSGSILQETVGEGTFAELDITSEAGDSSTYDNLKTVFEAGIQGNDEGTTVSLTSVGDGMSLTQVTQPAITPQDNTGTSDDDNNGVLIWAPLLAGSLIICAGLAVYLFSTYKGRSHTSFSQITPPVHDMQPVSETAYVQHAPELRL